jgi:hypothetical protein
MSSQREGSLDNFLGEIRKLKEEMTKVLPTYTSSLKELSSLPAEFERRFWASRVEALLQMVKADYEDFQAKAQKVDLLGKFMTLGIDIVLKAGGMQPVAPPPATQLGVAILPSGEIKPTMLDDQVAQPNAVIVSIDRFEAIARILMDEIMKGKTLPESEEEVPKLVYSLVLKLPKSFPEQQLDMNRSF